MKPIVILPPGAMSEADVQLLRDNDICVVVANDPDAVRFMDPPSGDYGPLDRAAIELFRRVHAGASNDIFYRHELNTMWARILMEGNQPQQVQPVKRAKK